MFNTPFLMVDQFHLNCLLQKNKAYMSMNLEQKDIEAALSVAPLLQKDGSRAMISIDGLMMFNPSILDKIFMSAVSTQDIMQAISEVQNDNKIKSVVFNMNTPGGEATKLNVVSQMIHELSKTKETSAVNTGVMASAGYRMASQCNHIFCDDSMNITGSIGTYAQVMDSSKHFEKQGLEVVHIATGPFKGLPAEGVAISEDMREYLMEMAQEMQQGFDEEILRKRQNVDLSEGSETKSGKAFTFEKAHQLGLVDGVKTIAEAFEMMEAKQSINAIRARL